jgi:hypothetical protein
VELIKAEPETVATVLKCDVEQARAFIAAAAEVDISGLAEIADEADEAESLAEEASSPAEAPGPVTEQSGEGVEEPEEEKPVEAQAEAPAGDNPDVEAVTGGSEEQGDDQETGH